jgi:membrane fusion protein (multidrug efflux system)
MGHGMKKKVFWALIGLLVLAGVLGGIKFLQINRMIAQGKQYVPPPATVTSATVEAATWEQRLTAAGSLEAVQGVTVTAELSGKIVHITFDPGAYVQKGDLLVQQDVSSETAQLRSDEATLALKKANHDRAKELLAEKVGTQATYDQALAEYKQAQAAIENIRSVIAKKTIRAPFAGRLGIRLVNLGQILEGGEPIVSLQALDPIFVNFWLPQEQLAQIQLGLTVRIATDTLPGDAIEGRITAMNPQVDEATRNIRIQATVDNRQERLRPGMFATVDVILPEESPVMVIPTTAVLYAPYSDSVFVLEETPSAGQEPSSLKIRQQFVRLGAQRGDFVAVISGLKKGEAVVSTGVFKFRNGQTVTVDNTLAPAFSLSPNPQDT